jgi:prepilin-type N-terminal cleavage/methylation domain-containing protein
METRSRKRAGFTLTELMIVLAVSGVLIAITIPSISGYLGTARLNGAINILDADLRNAHALASAQRRTYALIFQGGSYAVTQVSPPVLIRRRLMPRGVRCTASDTATFYAWGLSDPVTITFRKGALSRVTRIAANGRISHD